jgi:hypothetical protein
MLLQFLLQELMRTAMWHFSRGLAQARKHNLAEQQLELSHMKDSAQSTSCSKVRRLLILALQQ